MSDDIPPALDTFQASPASASPIQPPTLPAAVAGPWGPWPTLGISLIGMALVVAVPSLVILATVVFGVFRENHLDPMALAYNGDFVACSTLLTAPFMVGACLLFARLRHPFPVKEYLGLRLGKIRDLLIGIGALALFLVVFWFIDEWAKQPLNDKMLEMYRSARHPAFLWLAVVLGAPLSEEFLFRGFMLPGLARTRLGWFGAASVSTLAWAILHVQYHGLEIVELFVLGNILGWLRHRSNSIWVPFTVHALNNFFATIFMAGYVKGWLQP